MEPYNHCPELVLFLGGFLTLLAVISGFNIYPIMVRPDENRRVSFVLILIGVALIAVSRL